MFPNELVIIGVHSAKFPSEHETANIRQAILNRGITHPVVNDRDFRIWQAYAVRAWPTLVLIDPQGRIAGQTAGEIKAEDLRPAIEKLITENRDKLNLSPLDLRPESAAEPERPLRYPSRLLLAGPERLFIADTGHNRVVEVRLAADGLSGRVERVFGSGDPGLKDGPAEAAQFHEPRGLALRGGPEDGRLYVADTANHAIRAIDLQDGSVRTVAGTGAKAHGSFALGKPVETPLRAPWGLAAVDEYLFIAMAGSHQVWVLIGENELGPFAGNGREALVDGPAAQASFNQPSDLAFTGAALYVADPEASAIRAIDMEMAPVVHTLVGEGLFEFGDVDGVGPEARLQHPIGLGYADGVIYVADTYNNKIKTLDPATRRVATLIGSGVEGYADGSFEQATLYEPEGVQPARGRLYIADTNNHLVRVADLANRQVRTFLLMGLETLPPAPSNLGELETLPPVQVAPGLVEIRIEPRLPEGYERNPLAPARLRLGDEPGQKSLAFPAGEPIAVTRQVTADGQIPLELTLYYCREGEGGVCLIGEKRLVLPVVVSPEGGSRVEVPLDFRL